MTRMVWTICSTLVMQIALMKTAAAAPAKLTGLSAGQVVGTTVELAWNPIPGVKNYILSARNIKDATSSVIAPFVTGTRYVVMNLRGGEKYAYQVTACGSAGCSLVSDELFVTAPTYIVGPYIVKSGEVVEGFNISNSKADGTENEACVSIQHVSNVIFKNNKIGPCGPHAQGNGINVSDSQDVQILQNDFHDVASAVYAYTGTKGGVLIEGNVATQIRGPFPRGQLVQLNNFSGPNIVIRCNISDQKIGGYATGLTDRPTSPEDHINVYESSGTADSWIKILSNKLYGGGSGSGAGITAGDGSSAGYIQIARNVVVNTGGNGISVAGGHDVNVTSNLVFGPWPPSPIPAWSNVGIGANKSKLATECRNVEFINNEAIWWRPYRPGDAYANGAPNSFYTAGCTISTNKGNLWNSYAVDATPEIWHKDITDCHTSWRH